MIDFNALDERTEITIDDVNWILDKFYPKNSLSYEYYRWIYSRINDAF